jgi:hypothetical protein
VTASFDQIDHHQKNYALRTLRSANARASLRNFVVSSDVYRPRLFLILRHAGKSDIRF